MEILGGGWSGAEDVYASSEESVVDLTPHQDLPCRDKGEAPPDGEGEAELSGGRDPDGDDESEGVDAGDDESEGVAAGDDDESEGVLAGPRYDREGYRQRKYCPMKSCRGAKKKLPQAGPAPKKQTREPVEGTV